MARKGRKVPAAGERNHVVLVARCRNAGFLRDRRKRRERDRLNRELRASY